MRAKLGMLRGRWVQVREKKKGWLKVEEERYRGKGNERNEEKWKERKERALGTQNGQSRHSLSLLHHLLKSIEG